MAEFVLKSVQVKNYKNLASGESFEFDALNILIGPNGCGKSNLIALLKFLADAAVQGQVDSARGVTSLEDALNRLGNEFILDRRVTVPAVVQLVYEFFAEQNGGSVFLEIELLIPESGGRVLIQQESMYQFQRGPGQPPFYFYRCHNVVSGRGAVSIYKQEADTSTHFVPIEQVPLNELALVALPRLLENSQIRPDLTPLYPVRRKLLDALAGSQFYNANNMDLDAIRRTNPEIGPSDKLLSASGENLARVLKNLTDADLDFEETLQQAMMEILPWTRRIRAVRAGLSSLAVEWYFEDEQKRKELFYLRNMSDGSARMLCWATVFLSPQLPGLLVVEEPEIGVHPAWMQVLAGWIKTAARRTQVILSTHSSDLLDHLTSELEHVQVFHEHRDQQHRFIARRLKRENFTERLQEGWELGDLYRVGAVEVGGWPW